MLLVYPWDAEEKGGIGAEKGDYHAQESFSDANVFDWFEHVDALVLFPVHRFTPTERVGLRQACTTP
jgi:hypothetical protein